MEQEEIFERIKEKNITKSFFKEEDESEYILSIIKENPKLLEKLKNIPDKYWDRVLESGIIIFRDFVYETKTGDSEDLDTRRLGLEEGKKIVPTLVYQTRRKQY